MSEGRAMEAMAEGMTGSMAAGSEAAETADMAAGFEVAETAAGFEAPEAADMAADPRPGTDAQSSTAAPPGTGTPPSAPSDGGDRSLLALIDRLADLLQRSDLTELEVEAGRTGLVLRKPSALASAPGAGDGAGSAASSASSTASASAIATAASAGSTAPGGSTTGGPGVGSSAAPGAGSGSGVAGHTAAGHTTAGDTTTSAPPVARASVKAPLTGIFYGSPSPGAEPYVRVGGEVAVGQVIGLIEAMKLFNEIKSDLAGRVVRIVAEDGTLVKAKQPLIEVEPL